MRRGELHYYARAPSPYGGKESRCADTAISARRLVYILFAWRRDRPLFAFIASFDFLCVTGRRVGFLRGIFATPLYLANGVCFFGCFAFFCFFCGVFNFHFASASASSFSLCVMLGSSGRINLFVSLHQYKANWRPHQSGHRLIGSHDDTMLLRRCVCFICVVVSSSIAEQKHIRLPIANIRNFSLSIGACISTIPLNQWRISAFNPSTPVVPTARNSTHFGFTHRLILSLFKIPRYIFGISA